MPLAGDRSGEIPARTANAKRVIGFFCHHNPFDRNAFSGTPHFMLRALLELGDCTVRVLGRHPRAPLARRVAAWRRSDAEVRATDAELEGLDAVVSLVSTAAVPDLARRCRAPVAHVTDATPGFLRDVYGWSVAPEADAAERAALEAADRVIYSSQFMRDRAIREFGASVAGKTAVIPFGVNFDDLPAAPIPKPPLDPVRLLFVGRDWERKGGPVAVAAFEALRARGVAARLQIVGAAPEGLPRRDGLEILGFLDKNRPRELERIRRAFRAAHVLLLPTRADCTPMVVAEANSHAAPVLAADIGGVGSLMHPGVNGRLMPPEADGDAYADAVIEMTSAPERYRALTLSAFEHYRSRLNWSAWARDLRPLLLP